MAMNVGASGGVKSDINITPMVDVILVLLIIFMISVPLLQMGYPVQVPPKIQTSAPPPMQEDQIIVRMDAQGKTYINRAQIPLSDFAGKLRTAMTGRQSKVVFFDADGELREAGQPRRTPPRPSAALRSTIGKFTCAKKGCRCFSSDHSVT